MTRNELTIFIMFTFLISLMAWIHHQELKMVLTLSASDNLAVGRALDLVMSGYSLEPQKGKK